MILLPPTSSSALSLTSAMPKMSMILSAMKLKPASHMRSTRITSSYSSNSLYYNLRGGDHYHDSIFPSTIMEASSTPSSYPSSSTTTTLSMVSNGLVPDTATNVVNLTWFTSQVKNMASPMILIPSIILLVLWLELRIKHVGIHKKDTFVSNKTQTDLKEHKNEKTLVWKNVLPLTIISTLAIVAKAGSAPWNPHLWIFGPSASLVGYAFAFWVAEVTMDCCLDECHSYQPRVTILASIATMITIILKLTTTSTSSSRLGHVLFLWKAMEVLLATCIGRVIDKLEWGIVALFCSILFGMNARLGRVPSIPDGIGTMGWISYLTVTVGMSTLYQMMQNLSTLRVKKILELRAIARIVALILGTPPSWLLFDIWNFQIFMGWKVLVDSVALHATGAPPTLLQDET